MNPVNSSSPANWKTVHDFFANVQLSGTARQGAGADAARTPSKTTAAYHPVVQPEPTIRPSRAIGVEGFSDYLRDDYLAALATFPRDILELPLPPDTVVELAFTSRISNRCLLEGHESFRQAFSSVLMFAQDTISLLLPDVEFASTAESGAYSQIMDWVLFRIDGVTRRACLSVEIKTSWVFEHHMPELVEAGFSSEGLPLGMEGDGKEGMALQMGVSIGGSQSLTGLGVWTDAVNFVVAHQFTAPEQQPQLVFGRPSSLQCLPLSIYQLIFYAMIASQTLACHSYPRPLPDPMSFIDDTKLPEGSSGPSGRGTAASMSPGVGSRLGSLIKAPRVGQETRSGRSALEQQAKELDECEALEIEFDFPLCAKTPLVLPRQCISLCPPALATPFVHSSPSRRFDLRLSSTGVPSSPCPSILFNGGPFPGAVGTAYRGISSGEGVVIKLAPSDRDELKQEAWVYQAYLTPLTRSLLDSLREVHQAGIWHGDMRAPNVTRSKDGRISIIDFSHASVAHECGGGDCRELNRLRRELGLPDEASSWDGAKVQEE